MNGVREKTLFLLVLLFGTFFIGGFLYAWTNPSQAPPGGNVAAPLNSGGTAQTKTGNFNVGGTLNVTGTISAGSSLGVGTSSPADEIHVFGSGDQAISLQNSETNGVRWRLISDNSGQLIIRDQDSVENPIVIQRSPGSNMLYITSSSNVGIGTSLPSSTLHVIGTATLSGDMVYSGSGTKLVRHSTTDGSDSGVIVIAGGGAGASSRGSFIQVGGNESGTLGTAYIYTGNIAGSSFRVIANGESLHAFVVDGTTGNSTFSGSGGTCTINGSGACSSDIRLKKNITPLYYGLAEVLVLNPVTYQLKNPTKDQRIQVGLIAQEVEAVMPELTDHIEDIGDQIEGDKEILGVAYERLTPVLIKALQELNDKVDRLAKENAELKEKLGL